MSDAYHDADPHPKTNRFAPLAESMDDDQLVICLRAIVNDSSNDDPRAAVIEYAADRIEQLKG